jgi:hypothetical protein
VRTLLGVQLQSKEGNWPFILGQGPAWPLSPSWDVYPENSRAC